MRRYMWVIVPLAVVLAFPAYGDQVPVTVSLPEVEAAPGAVVEVPVQVSDVTGLNVVSSDLIIAYDARLITALTIRS